MAEKLVTGVKKVVQEVVTPGFNDLKMEVRINRAKQEEAEKRLNEKIDSSVLRLEEKISSGNSRLEQKIETGNQRTDGKIDGLAEKMDIIKTMTRLEMRVSELEKRK